MESLQALLQVRDVCRRGRERQSRVWRGSFIAPDSSYEKFSAGKPSRPFPTSLPLQSPASAGQDTHHTSLVKSRHRCSRQVHSYMHMCICIHIQTDRHWAELWPRVKNDRGQKVIAGRGDG